MKASVGKQLVKQEPQYEKVVHLTLTEDEAHGLREFADWRIRWAAALGTPREGSLMVHLAHVLREVGY